MIRRSAIFVALLASTAALAVPALASGASNEAKVTVGSPPTPYLPNGTNEPALAMDANHPAVLLKIYLYGYLNQGVMPEPTGRHCRIGR